MSDEGPIKGVMLPQRPPDGAGAGTGGQLGGIFRPIGGIPEPWGLNPVHKISMAQVAEKPPSVTALHKRWVRKFESEQAAHRLEEQMAATQEEDKIKAVGDFSAKLRTAILADDDTSFWKATQRPGLTGNTGSITATTKRLSLLDTSKEDQQSSPQKHPALLDDLDDFVNTVCSEATQRAAGGVSESKSKSAAAEGGAQQSSSKAAEVPAQAKESAGPSVSQEKGNKGAAGVSEERGAETSGQPSTSYTAAAENVADKGEGGEQKKSGESEEEKGSSKAQCASQERPSTAQSQSKAGKKSKPSKPAWALSQTEVEQKQMNEEDELLAFTEQLDFDSFMDQLDDVELKDAFKDLQEAEKDKNSADDKAWRKSFVRACNHAAMKQVQNDKKTDNDSDEEGEDGVSLGSRSICTTRLRAKAAFLEALDKKQDKWESSTRAGDDLAQMGALKKGAAAAEEFLLENPELKSVHSAASVKTLMDKAAAAEAQQKAS